MVFRAIVLVISKGREPNICNQRYCEFEIHKQNPEIRVIRRTFAELAARGRLNEKKEFFVYVINVYYTHTSSFPSINELFFFK